MSTPTQNTESSATTTVATNNTASPTKLTKFEECRTIQAYTKAHNMSIEYYPDAPGGKLRSHSSHLGQDTTYTFWPACGGSYKDKTDFNTYLQTLTEEEQKAVKEGKLRIVDRVGADGCGRDLLDASEEAEAERVQEARKRCRARVVALAEELGLVDEPEKQEWGDEKRVGEVNEKNETNEEETSGDEDSEDEESNEGTSTPNKTIFLPFGATMFERHRTIQSYFKATHTNCAHYTDAPGSNITKSYDDIKCTTYTFWPECGGSFQSETEYRKYLHTLT